MAKVTLFEDVCVVLEVDPDGKRFDKGPLARRCVRSLTCSPPQCRVYAAAATTPTRRLLWT